ncbi:archaeosine synthase subunit alpha [Methanococcoides methylutens]|uniref:Archaeosine tRNA-ribosyltransferase type 2 n=1 Tax=Methanococcoides methylutens MM1 TaxID=1434104 RepID=A0A0E3SQ60_METMT|nr:archaeosine synthase subunit alpha [Methanococcoides methylutens]AKB84082.1 archaeosine tRNA-ribosyltransferase type 2 [Methanococcoides methylutens MM1]
MTSYFEVEQRDGAARIGKILLSTPVRTPYIIETASLKDPAGPVADAGSMWELSTEEAMENIKKIREVSGDDVIIILPHQNMAPDVPDDVAETIAKKTEVECEGPVGRIYRHGQDVKKADLYVMEGAGAFDGNARKFLERIIEIRENAAPDTALYVPNLCTPANAAMLIYLGVDIVDNTRAVVAGHNDVYLTTSGNYFTDSMTELPCRCDACAPITLEELKEMPKAERADILTRHNCNMLEAEIVLARERIRSGNLREYVEGQCRTEPWLAALLRLADDQYDYMEEHAPLARSNQLLATTSESMNRAEVVRFARRVQERYTPPETDILVLLPCSAKKPYSISNSHAKFIRSLGKNRRYVHEVIITSPLGIVPREIEITYPAAHYDTVVTGYWDAEEIKWVSSCLSEYLSKNKYSHIIAHVEEAYREICEIVSKELGIEIIYTSTGNVSSRESLDNLKNTLSDIVANGEFRQNKPRSDLMRAIADYQFGPGAGELLVPEKSKIKAPFPKHQVFSDKKQIATLIPQYGTLALTIDGTRLLAGSDKFEGYTVTIDDFLPRGSLLAPGVIAADENIRPGDEVLVTGSKAIGVGRAMMSGKEMVDSTRGIAVDLRHIKKADKVKD